MSKKSAARPTIKDETPSGIEFEIYEYLTGRDRRKLEKPAFNFIKNIDLKEVKGVNEEQLDKILDKKVNLNPDYIEAIQDKLIEIGLVSLDGSKKNLVDRVLDLRDTDSTYIIGKLNRLRQGLSLQEKKK